MRCVMLMLVLLRIVFEPARGTSQRRVICVAT